MTTIENVKTRLDIVETVGSYVPNLKRSGRSWKANCPFHNERTPSFIVDPVRNSWHCFGACSTGGDVIEFVRRVEGLDFKEALARCAERAGVEVRAPTRREREQREEHERLLSANEAAAVFYQAQLDGPAGADALAYAERRGLDTAARRDWQLGYAPDRWGDLTEHLRARGFSDAELVAAGLAIEGERGHYDRFRGRLIFPIRDERGRLTSFGGRALGDDQEPKYLNTPQTPLFDKSGTMYGLDRAGSEARRADRLIVVEGYMDVIACHQAGLANVAASMGTAITERQMRLVKRFTPNVVLALDADNAGSEGGLACRGGRLRRPPSTRPWPASTGAAWSPTRTCSRPTSASPRCPRARTRTRSCAPTPRALRALVEAAKPVADHLFEAIAERADLDDPRARSRAVDALAPTVAAMADPIVRAEYVQRLARLGRVDEGTVLALIASRGRRSGSARPVPSSRELARAARGPGRPTGPNRAAPAAPEADADAGSTGEAQLLRLLLLRPECRDAGLELDPDTFEHGLSRRLFEAWCELGDLDAREDPDDLDEALQQHRAALETPELPEAYEGMTALQLGEAVRGIAWTLRARRRQARLRAEAGAVAYEAAEARRHGASERDELAANLVELAGRQREVALAYAARGGPLEPLERTVEGAADQIMTETESQRVDPLPRTVTEMEEPDDPDLRGCGHGGATDQGPALRPGHRRGRALRHPRGRDEPRAAVRDRRAALRERHHRAHRLARRQRRRRGGAAHRRRGRRHRRPGPHVPARDRQGAAAHGRRREAARARHGGVDPRRGDPAALPRGARPRAELRRDPRRAAARVPSGTGPSTRASAATSSSHASPCPSASPTRRTARPSTTSSTRARTWRCRRTSSGRRSRPTGR